MQNCIKNLEKMARTTDKFIASSGNAYGSISRGVCTGVSVRLLACLIQVDNKSGLFCRFLFQHFLFSPCGIKWYAVLSQAIQRYYLIYWFLFISMRNVEHAYSDFHRFLSVADRIHSTVHIFRNRCVLLLVHCISFSVWLFFFHSGREKTVAFFFICSKRLAGKPLMSTKKYEPVVFDLFLITTQFHMHIGFRSICKRFKTGCESLQQLNTRKKTILTDLIPL